MTETGNPITPSRVSILETLTKVTADPPKLASKSSIGFFEKIVFEIKNSWIYHPIQSSFGVLAFIVIAFYVLRAMGLISSRRLNAWGLSSDKKGGYFQLPLGGDEKAGLGALGLLGGNGNANGKAD